MLAPLRVNNYKHENGSKIKSYMPIYKLIVQRICTKTIRSSKNKQIKIIITITYLQLQAR
jgi:hypothetical protein